MAKHKILSHEETMELIVAAQGDSEEAAHEAREKLVECNTRLIWSVVHRFQNRGFDLEDLFQIGAIGMLKGIRKFDMNYGVKFTTYIVPMILGEVQRFIRDDGSVKVSRTIKELAVKIKKASLVNESFEHINEVLEVDNIDLVRDTIQYIKRGTVQSIDETVYENDGDPITLQDQLTGDVNGDNWLNNVALRSALEHLTDRERRILELRYFMDRTQTEASEELGISQVQVSRLEKKILIKMKELIEEEQEMPVESKGNREEAIRLLSTTEMPTKEISAKTGVPLGSMGVLSKKHRDPKVAERNKQKFNSKVKKDTPVIVAEKEEVIDLYARRQEEKAEQQRKREEKEAERRKINAAGVQTGRFKTDGSNVAATPRTDIETTGNEAAEEGSAGVILMSEDIESTPIVSNIEYKTVTPAVAFSMNMSLGGKAISKEAALASLEQAYNLVKLFPSDTVNLNLSINN